MQRYYNTILYGDNLKAMRVIEDKSIDLVYIDPPFNTGKKRVMKRIEAHVDPMGDRIGFGDKRYRSTFVSEYEFADETANYLDFLSDRITEIYRILKDNGSFFFHIDSREGHYCKCMIDQIFGRTSFMNEIIWHYDWGGRPKNKWAAKHNTIFWYAKNPKKYIFNLDEVDRIPYLAPDLVGEKKAKIGKRLTDVWFNTIVPTNSKERTGYPTQKPVKILDRIVRVHSNSGDVVLDCFAGAGSMGEAAAKNGRRFIMIDDNTDAVKIMRKRLETYKPYNAISGNYVPWESPQMELV